MKLQLRAWDKANKTMFYESTASVQTMIDMSRSGHWELMLATGLHDKNGKEIWEGDILKNTGINDGVITIVESLEKTFWQDGEGIFPNDYSEVIGNIYEHSHLLESK